MVQNLEMLGNWPMFRHCFDNISTYIYIHICQYAWLSAAESCSYAYILPSYVISNFISFIINSLHWHFVRAIHRWPVDPPGKKPSYVDLGCFPYWCPEQTVEQIIKLLAI